VSLLVCSLNAFAQEKIEVITLNYRSAEQVIPLIQPLVGKDGAVTGLQNRLVIRTSADRLAQIKRVIASIDSKPRRLMIIVRQNTTREVLAQEASVFGSAGTDHARVTVPETHGDAAARVELGSERNRVGAKVDSTRNIESSADVQRVQVLEGNAAFIRVGQRVPYTERIVVPHRFGATVMEQTQYEDVTSGYYVLPRVSGDSVTLEINPQRETLQGGGGPAVGGQGGGGSRGTVNLQQASTIVSGRIGEWIELGGVGQQGASSGRGTVYSTQDVSSDQRSIFVKVEEVK
jgi:type II secretory pathway component GspD/PulD (secretin)